MLKSELLKLIESIEDNGEVDEILKSTDFAKSILSLDNFKNLVATDKDFKSFMDSEKDKYNSKALDTWKDNNLQSLIDEKIKELYPEDDPKDLELKKLQQEMENMKKETFKKELTNKALKIATEKGLPTDLVDYFIGQDEEATNKNLETLEKVFTDKLETTVKERLKDNSYTPPSGSAGVNNPWSKEHFNLTKQAQILKENPELAAQLKAAVK
ncbi:DUF4355 domain-containing protein [Clostridium botulinum]|uniref:DUF4355 domain-containing protein n=1 Tax=Clostridium botulinum (strain Okra / Type B1) TaxID=498213 RepID=B1IGA5_CLOBK|nr:DUF4355 domain-containing protein [Clostridium botulinum]EKX80451.1 hypothetical protein CFSAN001628_006559 [Clostridium botulinum CFSAN001628]ACA46042.1 conserved hypothetical protein [Clostridium botulinum B1 str. Okra]MBD5564501.1 DUF4355 domain-containing protein [Clostridium botulinum]MBD5566582.1 DUF4355 domain-containing protein [Clostridium botulinum]MBD5568902.1 DUF4355 domain-containing protein [Clostridium botulinum]